MINIYNEMKHILELIEWTKEQEKKIYIKEVKEDTIRKNKLLTLIEKTDKRTKNRFNII